MTEQLYRRHPNAVTYGAIDPETGAMLMWVVPVTFDYEAAQRETKTGYSELSLNWVRRIVDAAVREGTT